MTDMSKWEILFVDDEQDICRQVKEFLEGEVITGTDERPRVETHTAFPEALETLETRCFDLIILDVRLGAHDKAPQLEEAGIKTLQTIQQRRFIPVVFYTGLPHLVDHLETPLIRVVEKTKGFSTLLKTVQDIFATRLPAVNRALIRHLETVQRDYMWDFVSANWEQFGDAPDRTELAYLLARRLAMSLSGTGIQQLARDLGDPSRTAVAEGRVHPMEYYVIPPVEPTPLAGDIYHGQIQSEIGYWVLLTPSCDMVGGREKADQVLFARCTPLADQPEYQVWQGGLPSAQRKKEEDLQCLLSNNRQKTQRERFYFLPGVFAQPDLVVDFQQMVTLRRENLDSMTRTASLDSPFAEALLARFIRYFGRLGTPDLDIEWILARLRQSNIGGDAR